VPLVVGDLVATDGAQCELVDDDVCSWACNGTCIDDEDPIPGLTDRGVFYISTEETETDNIIKYAENLLLLVLSLPLCNRRQPREVLITPDVSASWSLARIFRPHRITS